MRTKYNQKGQAYGKIRILDSKYDLRTTKFLKPTQENKEFIQIRNNMFKRMEELHKVIHGKDQGENVFLEYLFNKNDVEVSLSQDKMNKIHKIWYILSNIVAKQFISSSSHKWSFYNNNLPKQKIVRCYFFIDT